jgi:hypothetical protein
MDASAYQKAEFVHDLNRPVRPALHAKFDTVFDGGTIEHIFDIPAVFDNVDRLLRIRRTISAPVVTVAGV